MVHYIVIVGRDYEVGFSETITLVGSEQVTLEVPVVNDNVTEGMETFSLNVVILDDGLINDLRLGQGTAVASIEDDDGKLC